MKKKKPIFVQKVHKKEHFGTTLCQNQDFFGMKTLSFILAGILSRKFTFFYAPRKKLLHLGKTLFSTKNTWHAHSRPFHAKNAQKMSGKKLPQGKKYAFSLPQGKKYAFSFPREVFFRGSSFPDAFFVGIFWPLKAVLNIHLRFEFRLK